MDQGLLPTAESACRVAATGPRPTARSARVLAERPTYGTRLAFVTLPAEAAREAAQADKLVFLMHISGNFEDARFT
jgi:hypothetical protein